MREANEIMRLTSNFGRRSRKALYERPGRRPSGSLSSSTTSLTLAARACFRRLVLFKVYPRSSSPLSSCRATRFRRLGHPATGVTSTITTGASTLPPPPPSPKSSPFTRHPACAAQRHNLPHSAYSCACAHSANSMVTFVLHRPPCRHGGTLWPRRRRSDTAGWRGG